MDIAIISDTHSRYRTVELVLQLVRSRGIQTVLHCGDIEDAQTVLLFHGLTTHFVFGNCDTQKAELRQAIEEIGGSVYEPFGSLVVESRNIAWIHGDHPRLLRDLEQGGNYDFLFYGHSHRAEQHRSGGTLVINPGALHRARPKSFVVLDAASGELETVEVQSE